MGLSRCHGERYTYLLSFFNRSMRTPLFALTGLLALSFPSLATPLSARVTVGERVLPAVLLEAIRVEGSDADAAALAAAKVIHRYTQQTGFEACATMCKTPTGWAIQPLSVGSHTSCPVVRQCPGGSDASPSGLSIHSHRPAGAYRANRADMLMMGISHAVGSVVRGEKHERFSEEDFQAPGYMVTPKGDVWFQAGPSEVRRVTPGP